MDAPSHDLRFARCGPAPDSDFDLRGAHVLPLERVVGLDVRDETVQDSRVIEGLEMDIVSHDARKLFGLLLKKNGYVLEQLISPLIVHTTPEHSELKIIARNCITKHHSHHYFGFAETQWKLFDKERPRRVKPLLYVYRVLLTGIHLMRTGVVNANLVELKEEMRLTYIADLIARKQSGCLRTATTPRAKTPTWPFISANTNAWGRSCSQPTTQASCLSCQVMKHARR